MKKLIVLLASTFILLSLTVNTVVAQPAHAKAYGKKKFYYYPQSNVYFDAGSHLYYYNSGPSWTGVTVLPPGIVLTVGAPRYTVYYPGQEVWIDNPAHVVKYKAYKNKPIKYKKGKGHYKH